MSNVIYSETDEKALLGCLMGDDATLKKHLDSILENQFFVPAHKRLFREICRLNDAGEIVRAEKLGEENFGLICECMGAGTLPNFEAYLRIVKRDSKRRRKLEELEIEQSRIMEDPTYLGAGSDTSFILDARRFDLLAPPPAARSIYRVGMATIATPGNLCVIAAQAKAGKSALVGGFIAASTGSHGDTLGIASSNPEKLALIHFDTEQSPSDHHGIVATALRRVRADTQPSWLRSYRIADVSMRERFALLEYELERAKKEHGGIHSVLLDGVADLISDPNDPAEAFAAVERLHRLAVTYDTSIVCVLHFNPGSEFNKTRGHLGSQLERKAETNLALEKADGVTVVYTKLARHAHIEKDAGARFQWDQDAGMHLSCGTAKDEKAETDQFHNQATIDEAFASKSSLRYSEFKTEVMRIRQVKERRAEDIIRALVPKFVRKNLMGFYERVMP